MHYPEPISKLIDSFMKLPGIGPKTAARLAFFVLDMKEDTVSGFCKGTCQCKKKLKLLLCMRSYYRSGSLLYL